MIGNNDLNFFYKMNFTQNCMVLVHRLLPKTSLQLRFQKRIQRMSDDQFERWWIWSEMTSHASQITQTSSKQKWFLHEKILFSYIFKYSDKIEPDGPALKSDSDGLDPFQGTTKRLLIEYFRLFWIFSKRWTTNRITLNNTQYSKLLNLTQIGFRTKYPHKGIWSKSNCGTHCGIEPSKRSEHMRTNSRKWAGLYHIWVQIVFVQAAGVQLLADWRNSTIKEGITFRHLRWSIKTFSPAQEMLWWIQDFWIFDFLWSFGIEGVTGMKNVTCIDTCIHTL